MGKIPIVVREWMHDNQALFIYNGVERVAKLDGTNKEARYEVKKPRFAVAHTGKTKFMKNMSADTNKSKVKE